MNVRWKRRGNVDCARVWRLRRSFQRFLSETGRAGMLSSGELKGSRAGEGQHFCVGKEGTSSLSDAK